MYTVAVIDTDLATLIAMTDLLERNCHIAQVICFSRLPDYLSELKKGYIHISFIRVGSPGLQGVCLAKETLKVSLTTRVVFMSSAESYAVMAFEEGAWGYLLLPAEQERLDEVIENIIRREQCKRGGSP